MQRTDEEDKDIHRIAAVLSGVDLSTVAADHPGFHIVSDASLERLQRLVNDRPLPRDPPEAQTPYTPMTLPMEFIGHDGSFITDLQIPVSELHRMTGDQVQNFANPVFPIPAESEVNEAINIPINATT